MLLFLLNWLAMTSLLLGLLSALIIAVDEAFHPQNMGIMNVVWPVTALYFGLIGLAAYFALGRKSTAKMEKEAGKPFWEIVAVAATHCGGGCTLGDVVGEWVVYWSAWTIAGAAIWPEYLLDFALAYLLGIVFQYYSIAPMRGLGFKEGVVAAIKADTLSLLAFEIGLFAWMALSYLVFFHPHLEPVQPLFWFMMQIGMIIGYFTSYPMNWWLIKQGVKEAM
jgi:hypothetical protein